MMNSNYFYAAAVALFGVSTASAQVLFSESFDSEASAKVLEVSDGQTVVGYVDYSNFTIGTTNHALPEAPNQIAGSAATSGVVIQANVSDGLVSLVNLVAADGPGGAAVSFSGDYRLTFDMYLSLDPGADRGSSGTTELGLWGVGTDSLTPIARGNRNVAAGTFGWLTVDDGIGTSGDATLWTTGEELGKASDNANLALFESAFPDGSPIVPAANNHWVEVEVTVLAGVVTVSFNGVEFFSGASSATEGFALIGYEDPFGTSLSFSPDFQFGLFDNFVIEEASAPTLILTQTSEFNPVSEEGATTAAIFQLVNNGTSVTTISEVNLTGEDAANFSLATGLPISIPVGGSAEVELAFTAAGDRGTQTAEVEIVSDDAGSPSFTRNLSVIYAPVLLARYEFDEEAGTTVVDTSDNGVDGAFIVRDPLLYGQMSLVGGDGTSIGFTEANAPDTGNLAFVNPLHVPTTSFSLWVNPSGAATGDDTLFNRDPLYNSLDAIYGCYIDSIDALTFSAGGEVILQSESAAIPNDQVSHIVITHLDEDGFGNSTATRSRMYINGVMVAENLSPTGFDVYPSDALTTRLFVASRTAAGSGYTGLMDDLQIYSVELNQLQVSAMFNSPGSVAPPPEGLQIEFTSIVYDEDAATVELTWKSLPQQTFTLDESTDLKTWLGIEDGIPNQGEMTTFKVENVMPGRNYYRVFVDN